MIGLRRLLGIAFLLSMAWTASNLHGQNLMKNPSFEDLRDKPTQFGHLFTDQLGWVYDAPGKMTLGTIAHTGKYSYGISNGKGGKTRYQSPEMQLQPGRYRASVFVRGLSIVGTYNTAMDVAFFNGQYHPLVVPGTFGWTPITYVFQADQPIEKGQFMVGLIGSGMLWIDDVSLEKVGNEVALTPAPVMGKEEAPIAPPSASGNDAVRCPECGYRNSPDWKTCYACGATLVSKKVVSGPPVKVLADFENGQVGPFSGGKITTENAPQGKNALVTDGDYITVDTPQDWSGYEFMKFDVSNPQGKPVMLNVEIRDEQTRDYWTRVNFSTVVPPGKSTVSLPTDIYVGEKARPGRPLIPSKITRLVLSAETKPMIFDNIRLERLDTASVQFEGLQAFDFGLPSSPVMPGYTAVTAAAIYTQGRGYGWTGDSSYTRAFDGMQPDALFQDFITPQGGSFQVDLPNGNYHAIMNIDSPGGFWGEVQQYTDRQVLVNGKVVVDDKMALPDFTKWYYRNAHVEDLPGLDTFAQYVAPMFNVRQFDISVTDGKAIFSFKETGRWAIALTSLVIYPADKAQQGQKFWDWTAQQRKNQFDDYFKQIQPKASGAPAPSTGYTVFTRTVNEPAGANDGPRPQDAIAPAGISLALAGEEESPIIFAVQLGSDLGEINVNLSAFTGPNGAKLDSKSFQPGWLDYRITRVTAEGSVYTVSPRYWHPTPAPAAKVTRNLWIRTKFAAATAPGKYTGTITIKPAKAPAKDIPVTIDVLPFALDPVTDIAAGPWGCGIYLPWDEGDPATAKWNEKLFINTLTVLHDNGFNTVTGLPNIGVKAAGGKIELDFTRADQQMKALRQHGFNQMISSYGAGLAYNMYGDANGPDEATAKNAGFPNCEAFLKALYGQIEQHAAASNWLPIAWNLCDEPLGDAAKASALNAALHEKVRQDLKLKYQTFMGATSMTGNDQVSDHYNLVTSLSMPSLNDHDAASIKLVQDKGHQFSFYNGGTRWTFGRYMKALVLKYGLAYRVTWHYNACAGNPYYALDCREDDYSFYNSDEKQTMVPSVTVLTQIMPGLNDYRYLSTLQRLLKEKANSPAAAEAKKVFDDQINLVAGKDRPDPKDVSQYAKDRQAVTQAIVSLLQAK